MFINKSLVIKSILIKGLLKKKIFISKKNKKIKLLKTIEHIRAKVALKQSYNIKNSIKHLYKISKLYFFTELTYLS